MVSTYLNKTAGDFGVASADKHHAERERRIRRNLHRALGVLHNRQQQLKDVFARGARISSGQAQKRAHTHAVARAGLEVRVVGDECKRGIGFVLHVGAYEAHREQRAGAHVVLARVQKLLDLHQTAFDVPQHDHAQRRGGTQHTVLL